MPGIPPPHPGREIVRGRRPPWSFPKRFRLVDLRARVPRYVRDLLHHIARKLGASVDETLIRQLETTASAHPEEVAAAIEGFAEALHWPEADSR
ncbi:MAG: hypothetical protein JWN02_552 [Acidobacteria bacterium]|nr:hypothetical protein [Acidobacteriota bacterium]